MDAASGNVAQQLLDSRSTSTSVLQSRWGDGLGLQDQHTRVLANTAERRRSARLRLQMPMFLRGVGSKGDEYIELAKTLDISATGAYLACPRPLHLNDIVSLTIPAPPPSYSGSVPAATPPIQGKVKRLETAGDVQLAGIEFFRPLD